MRFPFTAYIENLRSHFKPSNITHFYPFISLHKEMAIFKFKKSESEKAEKCPKRQNVTKQELRTGKTFDSDMLHFCTFAICVRIHSCFGTS